MTRLYGTPITWDEIKQDLPEEWELSDINSFLPLSPIMENDEGKKTILIHDGTEDEIGKIYMGIFIIDGDGFISLDKIRTLGF